MTVECHWDNSEKTVIRCNLRGYWTWAEFHELASAMISLRASVSHRVDFLGDFLHGRTPRNGSPLVNAKLVLDKVQLGNSIMVSVMAPFEMGIHRMVLHLNPRYRHNLYVAHSLEEAYQLLETLRRPYPPSQP